MAYQNNIGALTKLAIGKETNGWAVAVVPNVWLSNKTNSVINKVDVQEDARLIGQIFTTDEVKVGEEPGGSIDLVTNAQEIGSLLYYTLAGEDGATYTAPTGMIMISYTGANAYADVIVNGGVITGSSGAAVGSKIANFVEPLSTYTTLNSLAASINAVSGWGAFVFGDGTSLTSTLTCPLTVVAQSNGVSNVLSSAILNVNSASATAVGHHVYDGAATTEWPSFTMIADITAGTGQALQTVGCKIDQLTIKISGGNIIETSINLTGKQMTTGASFPAVNPASANLYVSPRARVIFNGVESLYDKDITITLGMNMDKSKVLGSFYIIEQVPTGASAKISGTVNFNVTDWLAKYPDYIATNSEEIVVFMPNGNYADKTNDVIFSTIIKLNAVKYDKYDSPITGKNRITTSLSGTAVYISGKNHVDCYIVDNNTSIY